ncbi:phage tail protein [Burkholderia vietnamiensis]|uniref:phage tail protein n=1 Tax=Burkholderia vietnamiensis TaxID=60552 RepID=UPI001B9BA5A1|nr:phage tail protein [Burkholderia vietnamiensis]MBR8055655.1 phage tail protein [Burkholderia vietnamiensis]
MMMSLGQFVFSLPTLAYQELHRRTSWKHASTSRVGGRNARQFTGPGDDAITLSGWFAPDQGIGKASSLTDLRTMADDGDAYALVDGTGTVYGAFVIEGLDEGQALHMKDGTPRRIEFTLNLMRVDDGLVRTKVDPANEHLKKE